MSGITGVDPVGGGEGGHVSLLPLIAAKCMLEGSLKTFDPPIEERAHLYSTL